MTWSTTALGGAVATLIMIATTLFEFSYIPTTWNNSSYLPRRLLFLLVILALTCSPTFYIAIVESSGMGCSLSLILGVIQFFISAIAMLLFAIVPSGRMFGGDCVHSKISLVRPSRPATQHWTSQNGGVPLHSGSWFSSANLWNHTSTSPFHSCHDWHEDSRLHRSIFQQHPVHQLGRIYVDDHVCSGPHLVLPQHFPVVYHLEHRLLYWPIVLVGLINLDTLGTYLHTVTEEDLRKIVGNERYGGQVQTPRWVYSYYCISKNSHRSDSGSCLPNLECRHHLDVP